MKKIDEGVIRSAMTYREYRDLIDQLLAEKKTTGNNHSEAMIQYTELNKTRMNRLDKTTRLTEETIAQLARLKCPLLWLVITEAWCGDAAQIIPIMNRMAETSENIELKLILRDEHLDVMDAFLTNGGRSIPKLVILDPATYEVLEAWGPRPVEVQTLSDQGRQELKDIPDEELRRLKSEELKITLQKWYAKDKTRSTQQEIIKAIVEAAAACV